MSEQPIENLEELHSSVDKILAVASNDEVVQCARLLAMYLAAYKHAYGELIIKQEADGMLGADLSLFASGLNEMHEMLLMMGLKPQEVSDAQYSTAVH